MSDAAARSDERHDPARLVTIDELAALWSVSRRTIERNVRRGLPTHYPTPRSPRFDPAEANAWLAARRPS